MGVGDDPGVGAQAGDDFDYYVGDGKGHGAGDG